jgi:hypothetical protein
MHGEFKYFAKFVHLPVAETGFELRKSVSEISPLNQNIDYTVMTVLGKGYLREWLSVLSPLANLKTSRTHCKQRYSDNHILLVVT